MTKAKINEEKKAYYKMVTDLAETESEFSGKKIKWKEKNMCC